MEKAVLNYRVIIEPDERTGTNELCFTAYCPTLDVVSDGDTFEEALKNIREAIQLRVEVLVEDEILKQTKLSVEKLKKLLWPQ